MCIECNIEFHKYFIFIISLLFVLSWQLWSRYACHKGYHMLTISDFVRCTDSIWKQAFTIFETGCEALFGFLNETTMESMFCCRNIKHIRRTEHNAMSIRRLSSTDVIRFYIGAVLYFYVDETSFCIYAGVIMIIW